MRIVSWFFLIPLQFASGLLLLKVLTLNFDDIGGWNFNELVLLYGISMMSSALFMTFFIATWNIEGLVIRGELDLFTVRPLSIIFQVLFRQPNVLGLAETIPALIIILFAWNRLNLGQGGAWLWLILIVFVIAATFLRAGLFLALGSTAFWFTKSRPLISGGMMLVDRTTYYPVSVYPAMVQWVMTLLIPLAFIGYYPAKYLLGYRASGDFLEKLPYLLAPVLAGSVVFLAGLAIFYRGYERYESTGS